MKRWKQIISVILALALVLTACFQYGIGAKAADAGTPIKSDVSAIWSGQNGQMITFQLASSDWDSHGAQNVVPGSTYNTYNFYNNVQIYYNDGTGEKKVSLGNAHFDQIYFSMWGNANALSIQINPAYYPYATKIVIPAGTVFPAFAYTGGTPLGGAAIAGTSNSMDGYVINEDIVFEGTANATSQTYWTRKEATAVETVMLDLPSSTVRRLVFNIAGDEDNDALANWCYIASSKHDEYNTKDYVEIYLNGESTPKTLRNYYKTTDGNMYWNLYEAGSITFPLLDNFPKATEVEKIVIKKGCEFPSVAYTGANDPVGGGVFSATTNSKASYVVQEDVTFVISEGATDTNAKFTFVDTSATRETAVTGIKTGHNSNVATFSLSTADYADCSTSRPSEKFEDYNFMDMIQIVSGDTVQTLKDVYLAGDQIYYNMWDMQDSVTIALGSAYDTVTKIVIPAGTVFPSATYTGYGAWDATSIPDNMARNKGGFETTADITYEKPSGSGELIWTVAENEPQPVEVDTTIQTLDIKDNRFVFNISGDTDNDALTEWTYIFQVQHDAYNFKDNIEIYISGESAPKTLRDIFNTSDGNLYWNLYEAGSMSIPLISGSYDCTKIEKIVIKEGCQFPSVAFTGGNSLTGGSGTTATTDVFTTYVIREEVTLVPNRGATSLTASFVTPDAFATTETKVTGIKTGHSNKNVTFTLSETDYAGCETNRPSEKFKDYNFMDMIQIHSGDTVQSLKDVYPAGEEIYYNLWGMENTLTVALGTAYDTVTKIVIPAGTVFPAAVYTGYGAWNDVNIPDNMVLIKGGFETTTDITYVKPEGTGELIWFKEGSQPVKEDTSVTNIHVRTGEGSGTRLLLFLSVNDYGTQGANVPVSITANQYNLFERIFLYTTEGEKFALSEVYDNEAMYNLWGEFGSFSVKLKDGLNPIHKVEIEAGCEFSSRTFTDGTSETRLTYVAKESVVFMANSEPQDNVMTVHWTRTEVVPTINEDVEVIKVHLIGREGNVRLVLFLDQHDYEGIGESIAVTNKYLQYNSLENIVLCKGNTGVPLSEIVTDETYYNLWGNQGSVSYGLKPEYSANSFDNIIVKKGCEFPSFEYTSDENAEYKVAYTTTEEKTMSISELKYKIIYVGENQEVLYQDEVVCGSEFTLRSVPEKEGYTGSWDGLRYDVMPAQNITYRLLYESNSNEEIQQEQDVVDSSDEKKESPSTGDAMNVHTTVIILLLSMMAILTICFAKKWTDKDGGKNGR